MEAFYRSAFNGPSLIALRTRNITKNRESSSDHDIDIIYDIIYNEGIIYIKNYYRSYNKKIRRVEKK